LRIQLPTTIMSIKIKRQYWYFCTSKPSQYWYFCTSKPLLNSNAIAVVILGAALAVAMPIPLPLDGRHIALELSRGSKAG
jgi:hypothetical protein